MSTRLKTVDVCVDENIVGETIVGDPKPIRSSNSPYNYRFFYRTDVHTRIRVLFSRSKFPSTFSRNIIESSFSRRNPSKMAQHRIVGNISDLDAWNTVSFGLLRALKNEFRRVPRFFSIPLLLSALTTYAEFTVNPGGAISRHGFTDQGISLVAIASNALSFFVQLKLSENLHCLSRLLMVSRFLESLAILGNSFIDLRSSRMLPTILHSIRTIFLKESEGTSFCKFLVLVSFVDFVTVFCDVTRAWCQTLEVFNQQTIPSIGLFFFFFFNRQVRYCNCFYRFMMLYYFLQYRK